MNKMYWIALASGFRRAQTYIGGIIAVILGITIWLSKPDLKFSVNIIIPLAVLAIVLILCLNMALIYASKKRLPELPKILYVKVYESPQHKIIFLTEPCELFSHGISVSLYHCGDSDFEELICTAAVTNIQEDKKIQMEIINIIDAHKDIIEKVTHNDKSAIEKILVKPSIPHYLFPSQPGGN